jgi:murein DD-endopeptidase MepM/ murein hydrolase activator NlpD
MTNAPHIPKLQALLALAATIGCLLALAPAAHAALTATAVQTATASPPAFVPDWDGHTDSTVIQYQLAERSMVFVRIVGPGGRLVATIDAGRRDAGAHLVAWDGRDSDGHTQPPGTYRVRVDARPLPAATSAAGEPGAAAMGGTVVVAGARAATIQVQAPPVAVRGVRLGRATLGRAGKASHTSVRFDLSTDASIAAAIVDGQGRAVRTLAARRMRAGANMLEWDGRTTTGDALPDGDYALVVAASGTGRPTATTRVPLRIDRTLPSVRAVRRVTARASSSGLVVPVQVTVGEPTGLVLRVGRRIVRRSVEAGTHTLSIPGSELGLAASRRARSVLLHLGASDDAGNAVARVLVVRVPASASPAPTPDPTPPPTDPTPPATPSAGSLPWPIAGIVTSEFGMRNGRPHTGIDIAGPTGTPIHPVAAGTVSYVGVLGGYGNVVWVDHAGGLRTYYAHMSRFGSFAVGQLVTPISTIGYVGCTGNCSGPHVHFETRVADVPRDPRSFLAAG